MSSDEIRVLAARHFPDAGDAAAQLFDLLVTVADEYVRCLEDWASDEPGPYLGGTTPLDAAMSGLRENLVAIREINS